MFFRHDSAANGLKLVISWCRDAYARTTGHVRASPGQQCSRLGSWGLDGGLPWLQSLEKVNALDRLFPSWKKQMQTQQKRAGAYWEINTRPGAP